MELMLRKERSRSKSGKHAYYENAFYISRSEVREIEGEEKRRAETLYRSGEAYVVVPKKNKEDEVIVKVSLVRNLRGRVKGYLEVLDGSGRILLRTKYNKLKIRRCEGDSNYAWAVKKAASFLNLPVRRYNFRTGQSEDDRKSAS